MTTGSLVEETTVRILRAGDHTVLVELGNSQHALAFAARLRTERLPDVVDHLPAERTVMVSARPGSDMTALRAELARLSADSAGSHADPDQGLPDVIIPVHYDGADLDDVARLLGMSRAEVIGAHTGNAWRCAFVGFAPGFSYLESTHTMLEVPRRTQSRAGVPAGSVALAGRYSAVYPRSSPGGWQIIGTTSTPMWDLAAQPPALVQPGQSVRFANAEDS
jgi:KipI family sensor histidine kinase inhibitor